MKKIFLALFAGLACALSAQAQEPVDLLVTVTSADAQNQGIALVLAGQAMEQKARVRVLLCADGGQLAVKAKESVALKPRNVSPKEMLQALIKKGAQVEVCALFLPNSDLKQTDLIDGIGVAKPNEVATTLLQPNAKVLTF
jgi:predicted peroxiredoxin